MQKPHCGGWEAFLYCLGLWCNTETQCHDAALCLYREMFLAFIVVHLVREKVAHCLGQHGHILYIGKLWFRGSSSFTGRLNPIFTFVSWFVSYLPHEKDMKKKTTIFVSFISERGWELVLWRMNNYKIDLKNVQKKLQFGFKLNTIFSSISSTDFKETVIVFVFYDKWASASP